MTRYARDAGDAFAGAREWFEETVAWLAGGDAVALTHGELEAQVGERGRELQRRLYQGHLGLRAAREERRENVVADGVARSRVESGHSRPLMTVFGPVTVTRMAYRAAGARNACPADAELNLPPEKHSHGLRRLAAIEAARGSFDDQTAAIERATGVRLGKRQAEQLAARAAADIGSFYQERKPDPAPGDHVLVVTGDGKGIVMRPDGLRPATAKAAASAKNKLATRLSPGEKRGRKRMAELAGVYDCKPVPRAPGDIIASPGKDKPLPARTGPRLRVSG